MRNGSDFRQLFILKPIFTSHNFVNSYNYARMILNFKSV